MKFSRICVILGVMLAFSVTALTAPRKSGKSVSGSNATTLVTDAFFDANRIFSYVTNDGGFSRDFVGVLNLAGGGGMVYPYAGLENIDNGNANKTLLFASGLWLGATDSLTGDTLIAMSEYSSEFSPGNMSGGTFVPDDSTFGVFKLHKDSLAANPNQGYTDYMMYGVPLGAPVDGTGEPDMIGDQMLWSIYSDANPAAHSNDAGGTAPLGVEVQQTVFGFKRDDAIGDIMFIRYKITNKGSKYLRNMFISLWSDPDLGGAGDDLVACDVDPNPDSSKNLGYTYNANDNDATYGSNPPAVGFDFFQGPLDSTGVMTDSARMWGQWNFGYKNLPLVSFNKYINGTDPDGPDETYWYMNGLDKNGNDVIDPSTGLATKFFGNGDPVAGTGFRDSDPSDRRMMLSTGPISFNPGDSTEILAAIVCGQGKSALSSITIMRFYDRAAQSAYDNNFILPEPPAAPIVSTRFQENGVMLFWTDTSEVDPGTYSFQGYTIYQGESVTGPWRRLTTFDPDDGIGLLLDEVPDELTGFIVERPVQFGTNEGLQRHIFITDDKLTTAGLINNTDYYFKVEAYSYNPALTPRVLTASSQVMTVTPMMQPAGDFVQEFGAPLDAVHIGNSDGVVAPYVIDPFALNGHNYRVTFRDSTSQDSIVGVDTFTTKHTMWTLADMTLGGDTLILDNLNLSGDRDYVIVDGMFLVVTGPSTPGMKDWDIPAGTRRFTWASADFGFEGFNGAMGWGSPFGVFGGNAEPVTEGQLLNVRLILATVDNLGNFDVNDENVSYAYRYGRGFSVAPAKPEFAPFIINTAGAGYDFQDFTKSVPLSAWNMDTDPPTRLAVGHLENNALGGLVDGIWWPGDFNLHDNVDGGGPREWLWIMNTPYSETVDAALAVEPISNPVPVMWWVTANRRGDVPFSPGATGEDQFDILANKIIIPADTFTFVASSALTGASASTDELANVRAVPNPYYLFTQYEPNQFQRQMRFTNLPEICTMRIFNLSGELIRTLEKTDVTTSQLTWDLATENNAPVSSGIYIYLVTTPGGAEKIGKMAIFTEAEQLTNF